MKNASKTAVKVAEVSKKWFRLRDTYGVEIEPGQDDIVILAACRSGCAVSAIAAISYTGGGLLSLPS